MQINTFCQLNWFKISNRYICDVSYRHISVNELYPIASGMSEICPVAACLVCHRYHRYASHAMGRLDGSRGRQSHACGGEWTVWWVCFGNLLLPVVLGRDPRRFSQPTWTGRCKLGKTNVWAGLERWLFMRWVELWLRYEARHFICLRCRCQIYSHLKLPCHRPSHSLAP